MASSNATNGASGQTIRCAFYGRFSTNMQRRSSIEDQLRSCRDLAESKGWVLLDEHIYRDEAKTGTSRRNRSGLVALLAATKQKARPFEYVLFDDTSRLGRKVSDVLNVTEELTNRRVGCYFVGQNLDSREKEQFNFMLPVCASMDQNMVERLKKKVEAAHKGRFTAGYHVGSIPYGYEGRRIEDLNALSLSGQGATLGTKLVKVDAEAQIVVRIMQEFSAGHGMMGIARKLNGEHVPWPSGQGRSARRADGWSPEAIKRIVHNERYAGVDFYRKSRTHRDTFTDKITKEPLAPNQVARRDAPELRIVADDLWQAVQARLTRMATKNARRYAGGFARATETLNPWSGTLFCGLCGRGLTLGGKKGLSSYGCPAYRNRYGCTNHLRIRSERATEQLSTALSRLILAPTTLDSFIPQVYEHLKSEWEAVRDDVDVLRGLEQERTKTNRAIANLLAVVESGGASSVLLDRLRELEGDKVRLDSKVTLLKETARKEPTLQDLRSLIRTSVSQLRAALEAEPQEAREVLQRHLRLHFFPSAPGEDRMFAVIGDVNLFEGFSVGPKEGVLLGGLGTQTTQQHDQRTLAFYMEVATDTDLESPVLAPLLQLLRETPELSEQPRTPKEWAALIAPYVPVTWKRKLGSGAIGRYFKVDRLRLEEHIVMVRTDNPSSEGPLWQLSLREGGEGRANREEPRAA